MSVALRLRGAAGRVRLLEHVVHRSRHEVRRRRGHSGAERSSEGEREARGRRQSWRQREAGRREGRERRVDGRHRYGLRAGGLRARAAHRAAALRRTRLLVARPSLLAALRRRSAHSGRLCGPSAPHQRAPESQLSVFLDVFPADTLQSLILILAA